MALWGIREIVLKEGKWLKKNVSVVPSANQEEITIRKDDRSFSLLHVCLSLLPIFYSCDNQCDPVHPISPSIYPKRMVMAGCVFNTCSHIITDSGEGMRQQFVELPLLVPFVTVKNIVETIRPKKLSAFLPLKNCIGTEKGQ